MVYVPLCNQRSDRKNKCRWIEKNSRAFYWFNSTQTCENSAGAIYFSKKQKIIKNKNIYTAVNFFPRD